MGETIEEEIVRRWQEIFSDRPPGKRIYGFRTVTLAVMIARPLNRIAHAAERIRDILWEKENGTD